MISDRFLRRLTTRVLLVAVVLCVLPVASAFAARRYAVVVAVSQFNDKYVDTLSYVDVDARTMVETLSKLGFVVFAYCEPTAGVANAQEPTRENVLKSLQEILPKYVEEDDSVFFFMSAHGQTLENPRTREKRTYLLAKDTKLKKRSKVDPSTALSVSELREAGNKLRAKNVFFAFDACQSGGTRGVYGQILDALLLEDDFNVATLASCATSQSSYPVEPVGGKKISLFTYVLNEGLKGYADLNGNGEISTDELAVYVKNNVTSICDLLIPRRKTPNPSSDQDDDVQQTPYVVAPENLEPFVFANVKPRKREAAINEIAEQIATRLHASIKKKGKNKILLYFDASVNADDFGFGRERDAVLTFCDTFGEKLKEYVAGKLKDVGIDVVFVRAPSSNGEVPEFRCEFKRSDAADERVYKFSGLLSNLKDADGSDARVCKVDVKIAFDSEVKARLNEQIARGASTDEASVLIEVVRPDGSVDPRVPELIGDVLWVPLDVGEKYRIVYTTSNKSNVGVRALVDGHNTIGQFKSYVDEKLVVLGLESDTTPDAEEKQNAPAVQTRRPVSVEEMKPRVSLDEARFWYVPKSGRYTISGFYERSGDGIKGDANATYEPFLIASSNVKGSEQADQIGLIQVAFYDLTRSRSAESDVRTVPGKKEPVTLTRINGFEIPPKQEPFAYFSLRYASSKTVEELRRNADMDNNVDQRQIKEDDKN